MKKNLYLTIDTETANGLDDPMMYDLGGAIHDKQGNIIESFSFVIAEVFDNAELFNTAYYAEKRPMYEADLANGKRQKVSIWYARRYVHDLCARYDVKAIIAYNAHFDYKSTNGTLRYLSGSFCRYFLPYGIPVWDSWKMAQDTICKQKAYKPFCKEHDLTTANGHIKTSAEAVYRYMNLDNDFIEEHTGLEDVFIEVKIFARCEAQHKKMRHKLWND